MKSAWIVHRGKRILYINLSGFQEDDRAFDRELTEAVSTIGQEMYSQPLNSVLVLVDLRDTVMTRRIQQLLTERIADTRTYVHKTAVVGMHGIRKIFLDYFGRLAGSATGGFDEPEAGKDWLVK